MAHDPSVLPTDLPAPRDDGAADHLPGAAVPALALAAELDEVLSRQAGLKNGRRG